jgi:hypothetical protein
MQVGHMSPLTFSASRLEKTQLPLMRDWKHANDDPRVWRYEVELLGSTQEEVQISPTELIEVVVSRNSNEAIGQCASRLLDDPRRLVSPYTALQCPHRFSLFSCCS